METVGRAIGRVLPINYVAPSPIPLVPPPSSRQMLAGMEMADDAIDMREPAKTFNIRPTTVGDFAQRFFAGSKP